MEPISSSSLQNDSTKRKRLSLACNVCRRKKIKCDGTRPTCGKCQKFQLECSYTTIIKKRGPRQGHIDLLEQRLKKMEELLTTSKQNKQNKPTPVEINDSSNLPSLETMLHLANNFFVHLEILIPFAETESIISKIRNNTCNKFLLFSILSVGARYTNRPDIVKYPLWESGECFAAKAREMIGKIIEEPSIEHIQGLLILTLHEYGLARESRCWMYSGIALRMVLELGLHKELIFDELPGAVITFEQWYMYETRRRLFWGAFLQEKVASASAGRPQTIDPSEADILLPAYTSKNPIDFEIYQQNLDGTRLIRYTPFRQNGEIIGVQVTPIDLSIPGQSILFEKVGLESRIKEELVMLGKIAKLINRAKFHPNIQYEYDELNKELDMWEERLPPDYKNTPANFEKQTRSFNTNSTLFLLAHFLHNTLIVLLNRGSLVLADMPKLGTTTQTLQDLIIKHKSRCVIAADNVTFMLKYMTSNFDDIPPTFIYLAYISATVVVNNSFSIDPTECKKSEDALVEYYRFFEGMKMYWAVSEKMHFLMRDLYSIHRKVIENRNVLDQNDTLVRRMPLADIALSSSIDLLGNVVNNEMSQELTLANNFGLTSFDTWLQQQQQQKYLDNK